MTAWDKDNNKRRHEGREKASAKQKNPKKLIINTNKQSKLKWKEHSSLTTERGLTSTDSVSVCRQPMDVAFLTHAAERAASHSQFQASTTASKSLPKAIQKAEAPIEASAFLLPQPPRSQLPASHHPCCWHKKEQIYFVLSLIWRTFAHIFYILDTLISINNLTHTHNIHLDVTKSILQRKDQQNILD